MAYYYQIVLHATDGYFRAYGFTKTATLNVMQSDTANVTLTLRGSIIDNTGLFFDYGTLRGWSSGEFEFYIWPNDVVKFDVDSTDRNNPTIVEFWARWNYTKYAVYLKKGAGIKSAVIAVDASASGTLMSSYVSVSAWYNALIDLTDIVFEDGYGPKMRVKTYNTATTASPIQEYTERFDPDYGRFTVASVPGEAGWSQTQYVEISADPHIEAFSWEDDDWDAANIKAGEPISNMSAERWNRFLAKLKELLEAEGGNFPYGTMATGGKFYAAHFNYVRAYLMRTDGYGTLPPTQSAGSEFKAELFEGSGSLKSALNAAINHYNNS